MSQVGQTFWPEATVPFPIQYDPVVRQAIRELLEGSSTWLVLGSDDVVLGESPDGESRTNFYNSAFLLNPSGEIVERYAKRQLVIFGEYIPLVRWLPFMKFFTPIGGGFTSGDRRVGFSLSGMDARFAPLICFEDMFSRVVRYQTQQDLDFLLNITNDGWFGESAQQWQHAASASFRAIENGLPLVRCSNNGITCWIDSQGRMSDPRVGPKATPYSEGIQHIVVPLSRTAAKEWTFYRRYGDVFGWGCVAAVGLMLLNSKRNVPGGDYH